MVSGSKPGKEDKAFLREREMENAYKKRER